MPTSPTPDLGLLLSKQFRLVRKKLKLTQDEFAAVAGWSQPRVSRAERNECWQIIQEAGEAITLAGGDPRDLLRVGDEPASEKVAAIRSLIQRADDGLLDIVLSILRRELADAGELADGDAEDEAQVG